MITDPGAYRLVGASTPSIRIPASQRAFADPLISGRLHPPGLTRLLPHPKLRNRLPHESYPVSRLWRP